MGRRLCRCYSSKANFRINVRAKLTLGNTQPVIIIQNVLIIYAVVLGLGKHSAVVPASSIAAAPLLIFITSNISAVSITLPKLSILFFYHRIFQRTHRWFFVSIWIIGGISVGWMLTSWLTIIFQCRTIKDDFRPHPHGYCIPQWKLFLGTAIPSTIVDLVILVLPLPLLAGLQVPPKRKILLTAVFLCGYWYACGALVASCVNANASSVPIVSVGRLIAIAKTRGHIEQDETCELFP